MHTHTLSLSHSHTHTHTHTHTHWGIRYQEELDQMKTKSSSEESKSDDDGASGTMDALDLLKRVFQLKRFMGGDGGANGAEGGAAPAGGRCVCVSVCLQTYEPTVNGLCHSGCNCHSIVGGVCELARMCTRGVGRCVCVCLCACVCATTICRGVMPWFRTKMYAS
jgi:hypothetical protein